MRTPSVSPLRKYASGQSLGRPTARDIQNCVLLTIDKNALRARFGGRETHRGYYRIYVRYVLGKQLAVQACRFGSGVGRFRNFPLLVSKKKIFSKIFL